MLLPAMRISKHIYIINCSFHCGTYISAFCARGGGGGGGGGG